MIVLANVAAGVLATMQSSEVPVAINPPADLIMLGYGQCIDASTVELFDPKKSNDVISDAVLQKCAGWLSGFERKAQTEYALSPGRLDTFIASREVENRKLISSVLNKMRRAAEEHSGSKD